jgi:tetratricopeptide (TPR) repeat protein/predicted Ser/Thr protein kinase
MPIVPGFVVSHEIARGGMGAVYAAHDPAFDREVAVKVMHRGQDAERFVVESKVTAQLPHPGVPPVYTLGTLPDGRPFLAMKLIDGHTLADELKRTDLSRLLGIFEQICQTVGFAHRRGIIHRDLKPANVMVGAFGEVQVMDWGLAKSVVGGSEPVAGAGAIGAPVGSEALATVAGQVKGTPAYMAPEQARGELVGPPADVFALGGILAVMLTGKPPFLGDTVIDTILMAAQAELGECFAQFDSCGADAELVAVAKRCLLPDASARFADGKAVAEAVAAYRAGVEERLRGAERDRAVHEAEAREQRKRRKVQLALVTSVLLMGVGVGAVAWWQDHQNNARKLADEQAEAERQRVEGDRKATEARLAAEQQIQAAQAQRGIDANLNLASDLRREYKFKAADAALAQAMELAKGTPERLPEVGRARADLAFVVQFDDIRFRKWAWIAEEGGKGYFNTKIGPPEYQKAFAQRGLDLAALDPAEAAKRIAASAVKSDLLAAVDDWALYEPQPGLRDRLLEIARRIDPGPWTNRLRDPAVRHDKAEVEKLAADADPASTSAALSTLAELMRRQGLNPSLMLSVGRVRYPTDFELAFAQGRWHKENRDGHQLGPYEAARALRPENPTVWNNLGDALYFKNLDEAIGAYKQAIALDPRYAIAHANLGEALRVKRDKVGAIEATKRAIALDPKFAGAHATLGVAMVESGDLNGLAACRQAVALDPTYARGFICLAYALRRNGDLDGAMEASRQAVALAPNNAKAHSSLGADLSDKGDFEGAVVACKRAVALDPTWQHAATTLTQVERMRDLQRQLPDVLAGKAKPAPIELCALARFCARPFRKQFAAAVRLYETAFADDPKLANDLIAAHYYDAACYAVRAACGDGIDAPAEPAERAALRAKALDWLRAHLALRKEQAVAQSAAERTIAANKMAHWLRDSDLSGVRAGAGRSEFRTDELVAWDAFWAEVTETLARANTVPPPLEVSPPPREVTSARGLNTWGITLHNKGDLDEAIVAYSGAIKLDPHFASAHYNLGLALKGKGNVDGAIASYKAAIRLAPKYAPAHGNLGAIYQEQKKYPEAIACAREAIKADPKYSNAHVVLGNALRQTGDLSGAREALTEAARLDPKRWEPELAKVPIPPMTPPRELKSLNPD